MLIRIILGHGNRRGWYLLSWRQKITLPFSISKKIIKKKLKESWLNLTWFEASSNSWNRYGQKQDGMWGNFIGTKHKWFSQWEIIYHTDNFVHICFVFLDQLTSLRDTTSPEKQPCFDRSLPIIDEVVVILFTVNYTAIEPN